MVYKSDVREADNGKINWVSRLKDMLNSLGLGDTWANQETIDHKAFVSVFKQRIIDCFIQKWRGDIEASNVLTFYRHIKVNFEFENYLNVVKNDTLRKCLTRLLLASHGLRIETGRYGRNRIERNLRVCALCDSTDIEDAYHFVIVCPALTHIRTLYISPYYSRRPSVFKFTSLLATNNKKNSCTFM